MLELHSVIAKEDRLWAPKLGVEDRCTYEVGDMFQEVPKADVYLMKYILHDWEDEDCIRILSNVHDAADCSSSKQLFRARTRPISRNSWI